MNLHISLRIEYIYHISADIISFFNKEYKSSSNLN